MSKPRLVDRFMAELIPWGSETKTRLQVLKELQAMEFEGGEKQRQAAINVFVYWAKPVQNEEGEQA